jgi:hypothetical protein
MNKNKEPKEVTALRKYKEEAELSYGRLSMELKVHAYSIFRWLKGNVHPSPIMKRRIIAFLKEEKRKEEE